MSGDRSALRSTQPPPPLASTPLRVKTHVRQPKLGLRMSLNQKRAEGAFHEYPRVAAHEYQSFSVKTQLYCLSAAEETGNH